MRKRNNFRKRPKDNSVGLSVTVYNNNVEGALKVLKKKIKQSNLFIDLREREYYTKPSETKRQKRNLAKLRNHYAVQKEKENDK
jgi:small subunit ribosomal protein S21